MKDSVFVSIFLKKKEMFRIFLKIDTNGRTWIRYILYIHRGI